MQDLITKGYGEVMLFRQDPTIKTSVSGELHPHLKW